MLAALSVQTTEEENERRRESDRLLLQIGHGDREIAQLLELPLSTVLSKYHAGRKS